MHSRNWALAGGVLFGLGLGRLVAHRRQRRHVRDLYLPRAGQRHAALDWIARHPSAAALAAVQDWLAWEPIPALQRSGARVLSHMAARMGQEDGA